MERARIAPCLFEPKHVSPAAIDRAANGNLQALPRLFSDRALLDGQSLDGQSLDGRSLER